MEHRGPIPLRVKGSIPSWAAGSLYRTGPGVSKIENVPGEPEGILQISHWFDGLAHTHRFDIVADPDDAASTRVIYSSRRQCDDWIKHAQTHGKPNLITFAQRADPCIGMFGKIMTAWKTAQRDDATRRMENISVTVQADIPGLTSQERPDCKTATAGHRARHTVCLGTDASMLREIDTETLESKDFIISRGFHPSLDGPLTCAHPERCPVTGDYFNINIKPGRVGTYCVFKISAATAKTEILTEFSRVDLPMAYIHSFFLSEHFVIIRVPCSHIKVFGLGIIWENNVLDAMVPFDKNNKCRWFLVDRHHGRGVVAEFETEASFFFHTVNCFEQRIGGEDALQKVDIICDAVEYPTMDILSSLYYDVLLNREARARTVWGDAEKTANALPRLARWKFSVSLPEPIKPATPIPSIWDWWPLSWIPWSVRPTTESEHPSPVKLFTVLPPHAGELPTMNPAYRTRRHRYIYSLAMSGLSTLMDSILKTDMETREVLRWNNPHGHTPGEAIFVARPGGTAEDDGVLLSVVLDGTTGKSYLMCLDAQRMVETGRAEMDFAVGFGFHGVHIGVPGN